MGQRDVLLPADSRIAERSVQAPQHLGADMRVAAGDDDAGRRTSPVAVVDRGGRGDVVVDVDVEGGQREELVVLAAAEGGDVRLAQRLADIEVLSGFAVLGDGALDQLVQLIGAEDRRMLEPAIAPVGPRELDAPVLAAVEPALEQVADMAAHLHRIWLDHWLNVGHVHQGAPGKEAGGPKPSGVGCQNTASASGSAAALAAGGGTCWAVVFDGADGAGGAAPPCQRSPAAIGLTLGSSAGRSTHLAMARVGR